MLLLSLRGLSKPGGEERIVYLGYRNTGRKLRIVLLEDTEGIVQVIGLKQERLWQENNCICLNLLNELYDWEIGLWLKDVVRGGS